MLKDTFECGQCFRFNDDGNGYVGVARKKAVRFIQGDGCIYIKGADRADIESIWLEYLSLDKDYSDVIKRFEGDEYIKTAAEFGKGIRILRQEPCETALSFIISSNNNIKRIKKIIEHFCRLFGKEISFEGKILYTFPTGDELTDITVEALAPIKAGFRDKYIYDAAQKIVSGEIDFEKIALLPTDEARKELMRIKGVGEKVADCVLLFGFDRGEAFPKDVWIKHVMTNIYGEDFDEKRFSKDAGIIQQWMFNYARLNPDKFTNTEK
ncbi:MAG: DNA-3-methyladenine glycosylase 2 family protein [Clostridia bacterium]|nr:DNA-3-methyladenine glycosylase 2 family protein [Clostridia bacterium]